MSENRLKQVKVELKNIKRKITNFDTFVENYDDARDFLSVEKRKSDIDAEFANFESICLELDVLDDPIMMLVAQNMKKNIIVLTEKQCQFCKIVDRKPIIQQIQAL